MKTLSEELYKQFSAFLEAQSGIVLGANKQYLVKSRLAPLLGQFESCLYTIRSYQALHGSQGARSEDDGSGCDDDQ